MPFNRRYKKKKFHRKKRYVKKQNNKYRRAVARIVRPLNVKPRSAAQNVQYYNAFLCRPVVNTSATTGSRQQNFALKINLNSLWPFETGYDDLANNNGQILTPNDTITTYQLPVTDSMTIMPNVKDGSALFEQYATCAVVGTKVTLVATPIGNSTDNQMGYLYAIKHSQPSSGLAVGSSINEINKMPYRKMAKIAGPDAPTSGFESGRKVGARLVVTHSPKRFNNVKDLRDNQQLFCATGSNSGAHKPNESDYMTIGVIPSLNGLDEQVTDFCLQIRIEQRLLWTEPKSNLSQGNGNYSFPWKASLAAGAITAGGMFL